jgi:N-acetylmuramoyl-L-alanine amidase
MDSNEWPDISYHFLVGEDNLVYVGRGWSLRGENVGDFNNQAINIGFIGNFQNRQPADNTREILNRLIQCGIAQGYLTANVQVAAQCQVTPIASCSATRIFEWISSTDRFVENPRAV